MKKPKHLSIRLSMEQFKKLADNLVIERKSKSSLLREILEDYFDGRKSRINNPNQPYNKNKKTS